MPIWALILQSTFTAGWTTGVGCISAGDARFGDSTSAASLRACLRRLFPLRSHLPYLPDVFQTPFSGTLQHLGRTSQLPQLVALLSELDVHPLQLATPLCEQPPELHAQLRSSNELRVGLAEKPVVCAIQKVIQQGNVPMTADGLSVRNLCGCMQRRSCAF
ncbi:hypothetical protein M3J09_009111 [Ascochyta lentis]